MVEIDKLFLNFLWKSKRPRIMKTSLEKNKVKSLTLHDFKTYFKAVIIRSVESIIIDTSMEQSRVHLILLGRLYTGQFFDKATKVV